MKGIAVHHGDCREVIPTLGILADAVVTDPPYGLEFMGKEWDKFRGANSGIKKSGYKKLGQHGTPTFDANRRNQKCPRCGKWSYDYPERRCACGGAQAEGRRIYCTGFQEFTESWARIVFDILRPGGFLVAFGGTRTYHRLVCAIEDAGFVIQDTIAWLYGSGFPKRRDMLKPAFEPIVLAYKPGGKRTMQVDECRISGAPEPTRFDPTKHNHKGWRFNATGEQCAERASPLGRWPANVCHDGSEEVTEGFAAFGKLHARGNKGPSLRRDASADDVYAGGWKASDCGAQYVSDAGTAARFFYCAKADKQDRWGSRHPTVKPVELMKWLVKLVTPPGGVVLDPFAGTGTTGVAALATGRNAILIEREAAYVADIHERLAFYEGDGAHSTQAKNRNRPVYVHQGDLFEPPSNPRRPTGDPGSGWNAVFDPALDCTLSYEAAIKAIGERVKAGEPLPPGGYFGDKP